MMDKKKRERINERINDDTSVIIMQWGNFI